jgi:hypothetical protein
MDVKHDVFPGGALMGLPVFLVFKEGGSPPLFKLKVRYIWMWPSFSLAFLLYFESIL